MSTSLPALKSWRRIEDGGGMNLLVGMLIIGSLCALAAGTLTLTFLLWLVAGPIYHGNVASGVTADKVLQVHPGMAYDDVVLLLGRPTYMQERYSRRTNNVEWWAFRRTQDPNHGSVFLHYSRDVFWAEHPMVYVSLDDGRVGYTRVDDCGPFGFGHEGVYQSADGNDIESPWNLLVGGRDRRHALGAFYRLFGEPPH